MIFIDRSSDLVHFLGCTNGNTFITFDDLGSTGSVPSGYKNIIWTNANAYLPSSSTNGYYTALTTSPYDVFNPSGNPMTIESANANLITLYSLVAAAAWYDNLQLTVVGYNSNTVVATATFTLQVFTASYLTFSGFTGLDTITFTTSGGTANPGVSGSGTQFAMDNICLNLI